MTPLHADALRTNPRFLQAKAQMLETLQNHSKQICAIQPPHPERAADYAKLLERAKQLRGGELWYPYVGSGIGNGPFVELADGSVKIDFISGIGVHLGHSLPELAEAAIDAALDDTIQQGNLQQNNEAIHLMERLTRCSGFDHCFLSTSGAMANENALKIAFQKRRPANRILCFSHNFAGRTSLLAEITDKPAFRQGLPSRALVDYVPFFDSAAPEASTERSLKRLREHLQRHPGEHAAMIMELVQGEGGFYAGERNFFLELVGILKAHDVLVIVDEIQTFGRTPMLFAFQHFGLEEVCDLVTIGKLSQCCATLFRKNLAPDPGLISQTFISSSAAIRAAIRVVDTLESQGCFGETGRNQMVHEAFVSRFETLREQHPGLVAGPYGLGSMVAFTPLDGSREKVVALAKRLFDKGVMGFVAGGDPWRLRFLVPSATVDLALIDTAFAVLRETLLEMV